MPRIITDIDGTIIADGQPVQKVLDYIASEAEEVVVLTNRPETDREKTVADLKDVGLKYDQLIMNKDGSPAPEFKAGAVKAMLDAGLQVDEFIDNDPANRAAVEALGVEVCDPAEIVAGEEDMEEDPAEEASAVDRISKFKNAMSKLTPEAENAELTKLAVALTAERDDLRATVEKLTVGAADELTAAKADIVAKDARIAELTAALEKSAAEANELSAKVTDLSASQESAAKQAAKMVSAVSAEPVALTPAPAAGADADAIKAEYLAMSPGPARIAFMNKHRQVLIK